MTAVGRFAADDHERFDGSRTYYVPAFESF